MAMFWQEKTRAELDARIQGGRLGHAPLIHGAEGLGKRVLAEWLTRRLLCAQPQEGQPCGHCKSCELVAAGAHPDLFIIEPEEGKQSIGVDAIRKLIDRLHLTASAGSVRIGLLPNADAMNRNAANALLKTLEEPAAGAWLILVSERPDALPATVLSRCQQFGLRVPDPDEAANWLSRELPEESSVRRDAALALAGGSPLAARAMLSEGQLDEGLEVLAALSGGAESLVVIERWQRDARASWQWLARWMAVLMQQRSGAGELPLPDGSALPPSPDRRGLARLWQEALAGHREAVRGVVRQDLLFGRWLLEWQSAQSSGN